MPIPVIETHPQRKAIIDRILAGMPVRAVCNGLVPPVSPMSVQRYKANVVKPVLARATEDNRLVRSDLTTKKAPEPLESDTAVVQAVQGIIAEAAPLSLVRSRMAKVGARLDRVLDRAETAVRTVRDEDGNEVPIGPDLAVLAPLINQEHKHIELWGRISGELEHTNQPTINIQVVQCNGDAGGRD